MYSVLDKDTIHYLFAGRFLVYVLCIALIIGCIRDIIEFTRDTKVRKVARAHQITVICASAGLMLSSPFQFHVFRRLFGVPREGLPTDLLLLGSVVFVAFFFLFAQVTRALNRNVPPKRVRFGVYLSVIGMILVLYVGLGIDVRL